MDFKEFTRHLQTLSPADRKKLHLMLSKEFDISETAASRMIEEIRERKKVVKPNSLMVFFQCSSCPIMKFEEAFLYDDE